MSRPSSTAVRAAPFFAADPRGLDHVVAVAADLDAAAERWAALGFTLTPRAEHPWGTANRLVQFDGSFVEILAVAAPERIPKPSARRFSFGAFNRDFLARREGMSMLVLESTDSDGDIAAFAAAGLPSYQRFDFERIARLPEGEEVKVGFSLAFTGPLGADGRPAASPDAGFFTCRQHHPENFWRADYQVHPNTATGIAEVVLVADDPADHHIFLSAFAGVRDIRASSRGLTLATPRGRISCLTPAAFRHWYGEAALPRDSDGLMFGAIEIAVERIGEAASQLLSGGFHVADRNGALIVSPDQIGGVAVAFR